MATKLYMKQFQNSFQTSPAYNYASLVASVLSSISSITNKINGVTQDTFTAGGAVIQWVSKPLAASITISGTITYNAWVLTSSVTGAPKTVGRVYKLSGGVETQISSATSSLVQSTSIQLDNFTDSSPTPTTFAQGDRIVIKFFVSSTSATGTETLDYGGKTSAADGDTWVQFTENLVLSPEPEFIQQSSVSLANSVTLPGISAQGNTLIACVSPANTGGAHVTSWIDDKGDAFLPLDGIVVLSSVVSTEARYVPSIAGGSATVFSPTMSSGTNIWTQLFEYAGLGAPDQQTNSTNNSGSASSDAGPVTTLFPQELLVAWVIWASPTTATAGTNYVLRSSAGTQAPGFEDRYVTSTGSYDAPFTGSGSSAVVEHYWTFTVPAGGPVNTGIEEYSNQPTIISPAKSIVGVYS